MKKTFAFFIIVFSVLNLCAQEKKVALLIGNSDYTGMFSKLHTPSNDVDAMENMLKILDFEVISVKNISTTKAISDTLSVFQKKAKKANIALFYFSGHGGTINKKYYLVPSGYISSTATLSSVCFSFDDVEKVMKDIGAEKQIYFIDACRNALDGIYIKGSIPVTNEDVIKTRNAESGSIQCYATSENKEAISDGKDTYSIFTEAIINHIADKETFNIVWKRISEEVTQKNPSQQPVAMEFPEGTDVMSKLQLNANSKDVYPYWNRQGFARVIFTTQPKDAIIKVSKKTNNRYEKAEIKEYKSGEYIPMKFGLTYEYEISCHGYAPYKNTLTLIPKSNTSYKINLTKLDNATMKITSNAKRAKVTFDGKDVGNTPLTINTLSGNHDIKIEHSKYHTYYFSPVLDAGEQSHYAKMTQDYPWFWEWDEEEMLNFSYHYSPKYQISLSGMYRPDDSRFSYGAYIGVSPRLFSGISSGSETITHIGLDVNINTGNEIKKYPTYIYGDMSPYSKEIDPYNEAVKYDGNALLLGQVGFNPLNGITLELGIGAAYHCDKYYMKNIYDVKKTKYINTLTQEVVDETIEYTKQDESRWYNQEDKWSYAMRLGTMLSLPISDDCFINIGGGYTILPMNKNYSSWDVSIGISLEL